MAKRRGNNEGSIYQVGDHWEASVTMRRGVRRRLRRPTYELARQARDELIAERNRQVELDRRLTVGQLLDQFLDDLEVTVRRPRTWEAYESVARLHIKPFIGSERAAFLTPSQWRQHQTALLKGDPKRGRKALAPATVVKVRAVLSAAYSWAVAEERLPRNPVDAIKPPAVPDFEARPLTVAEVVQVLKAIQEHDHGPLWRFMIATGCRWQDAAGLRWSDVDLVNLLVRFRKASARVPKPFRPKAGRSWELGDQKTRASRRAHPLASLGVSALVQQPVIVDRLRDEAGDRWQEHDLVFPSRVGTPLRNDHVGERWHAVMRSIGVEPQPSDEEDQEAEEGERVRMHDLRHTMVTIQRRAGTDLRTIRDLVGHASTEMTDLYAGVIPEELRRAIERQDRLLVSPIDQTGGETDDDPTATKTATGDAERAS